MSTALEAIGKIEDALESRKSYDSLDGVRRAIGQAKSSVVAIDQSVAASVDSARAATESAIAVVREKGTRIAELESDLAEAWATVRVTSAMYERMRNENEQLRIRMEELLAPPLPSPIVPEASEQYPESRVSTKKEEK